MLPYSLEESLARAIEFMQAQYTFPKSKHLSLPGYITYQVQTSV